MSSKRDYYEVLGVAPAADANAIRSAHRKLAREFHPDINKDDDASAKFSEIQEAYDVLSDTDKRARYDRMGHAGVDGPAQPHGGGGAWSSVDPDTFEDIFGGVFGGRRRGPSGFGDFRGGADFSPQRGPQRGSDAELTLDVGFATAAFGGKEQLRLGSADGGTSTIDVTVPKGTIDGAVLRVRGKGHSGTAGGSNGDLLLKVHVGGHPWFTRDGLDLSIDVPISIVEASIGGKVGVPLLRGTATLTIPPGVSSGARLRLKGKGITDEKDVSGDLYALIEIVAPENISDTLKAAIEAIAPSLEDPRANVAWAAEIAT